MTTHEKAAGVLDTPTTAQESKRSAILGPQAIGRKELDTLRARFARRGYVLQRVFLVGVGHPCYHVTRNTRTRILTHPGDVGALLAEVEGKAV